MTDPELSDAERRTRGEITRREVLGDEHVDRSLAATTPVTADFQDFIARTVWGDIWSRPGLERRLRSTTAIVSLVSLGHWDELPMHLRAALGSGLTRDEVVEILLQTAIYAGVPAANKAFAIAREVFAQD